MMQAQRYLRSPLARLISRRLQIGLLTILLVTVLVFLATEVLPGDAARVALGRGANETTLAALRARLHLDTPVPIRYARWLEDLCTGHFGASLVNGKPVAALLAPRVVNSAILLGCTSILGIPLAIAAGIAASLQRGRRLDRALSTAAVLVAALPEFVVGIGLILLFATAVLRWLPPVSMVLPGASVLSQPKILVLPVMTLILVIFPYVFRMTRVTMIDVLDSEFMEMAALKGLSRRRMVLVHALPNALSPTIQVVALTFAYLAGGTVMVEYLFGYAGLGQGLMQAVEARDIPIIQAIVLLLASVYVLLNVGADIGSILLTPRLREGGRSWQAA